MARSLYASILAIALLLGQSALGAAHQAEKFAVIGHAYGKPAKTSPYPSSALLANIDLLNTLELDFVVFTGDFIQKLDSNHVKLFQKSVRNKLNCPVYFTPGNHDLHTPNPSKQVDYVTYFGNRFGSFETPKSKFIFLDTEQDGVYLGQEQWEFVKHHLKEFNNSFTQTKLFLFSHRSVWAYDSNLVSTEVRKKYFSKIHSVSIDATKTNLLDLLNGFDLDSKEKHIYWFSGDPSLDKMPLLHFSNKLNTYVESGLFGNEEDHILLVANEETVRINALHLRTHSVTNVSNFSASYWEKQLAKQPAQKRGIWLLVKEIVKHRYFWYGSLLGAFFIIILLLLYVFRPKSKI